jgi:dTDP-4-amino-4,6-dideoxygalactose transaminase
MTRRIAISAPVTGEEEWQACREPLLSGWLTQGPKVAAFEKAFAERHQVAHAIAVTSCTTALHLALAAVGVGPGDEVIVPAFTWVATANAVLYCGATPVFADVDRTTYNLDFDSVARKVTPRTRALIAVHLFGRCVDVAALRAALPSGVALIEDAACAAGAAWQGRPAGSLGTVAAFSFHPRKSVTTGEGGMVTTNDAQLARRIDQMRNHGATVSEEQRHSGPRPYLLPEFDVLGYNYRMTDLQGAVGLVQLRKLDAFIDERASRAGWYREALGTIPWLRLPDEPREIRHGWQAFVTYVDPQRAPASRNDIMQRLEEQGIATRPGTHAVHMLAYYRQRFGLSAGDFPGARDCAEQTMAIPLHNRMSAEDYEYVAACLRQIG